MNIQTQRAALFLCFISLLISTTLTTKETAELCSESKCGRRNGYVSIRFPFRLITNNIQQPKSCGFPGFDLYCDEASNKTLFNIPNSGNFTVEGIDYRSQQIMLGDPDDCLARKILQGIDFSSSPFFLEQLDSYSFYNCSEKNENYTNDEYWRTEKISCLSTTPNHAVIRAVSTSLDAFLEPWCEFMGNVWAPAYSGYSFSSRLRASMMLTWLEPQCRLCEENVTRCEFKNGGNTTRETTCIDYDPPLGPKPLSKRARYRIGIFVGLGVPTIAICILLIYKVVRYNGRTPIEDINTNNRGVSVEMASHGS